MTLWIDAFGRGMEVGDRLGQTMAERAIRRRTRDVQTAYDRGDGSVDEAALEAAYRDAENSTYAARSRDMREFTNNMMERGLRSRAADLSARNDMAGTVNPLRALARTTGNVQLGEAVGNRASSVDALAADGVTDENGRIVPHVYQDRLSQNRRAAGDAEGALAANSEFEALNAKYQATLSNDIQRILAAGAPPSQAIGHISELLQSNPRLAALDPQIYTSAGPDGQESLYVQFAGQEDGFLVNSENIPGLLKSITDPNIVDTILGRQAKEAEAAAAFEADQLKGWQEACGDIIGKLVSEFGVDDVTAGAGAETVRALQENGVKVLPAGEDGALRVQTRDGIYRQMPAEVSEDGRGGYAPRWVDEYTGQDVDAPTVLRGAASQVNELLRLQQQQQIEGQRFEVAAFLQMGEAALRMTDQTYGRAPAGGQRQGAIGGKRPTAQNYAEWRRDLETLGVPDRANARAGTSSATGIDQFIDSTWLNLIDQMKPGWADGKSDQELLAMRTIPEVSGAVAEFQDRLHGSLLQRAGLPTDAINMYAMHKLGQTRGMAFARAPDDTPIGRIYSDEGLVANNLDPSMTKGELIQSWIDRVGAPPASPARAPNEALTIVPPASATAAPAPAAALPRGQRATAGDIIARNDNAADKELQQIATRRAQIREEWALLNQVSPLPSGPLHRGGTGFSSGSTPEELQAMEARRNFMREDAQLHARAQELASRAADAQKAAEAQTRATTIADILARSKAGGAAP